MFITNKRVILPTNIIYNTILIEFVPKLSLIIYFSKYAIQKLEKTYYNYIYKLFKINTISYDTLIINSHLKKLNLMSFQHQRFFQKLVFLAFNVKYGSYSPNELKDCFHCNIKNMPYNLRESSKEYISLSRSNTSY